MDAACMSHHLHVMPCDGSVTGVERYGNEMAHWILSSVFVGKAPRSACCCLVFQMTGV